MEKAKEINMPTLNLTSTVYQDDFSKTLSSHVSQTIFLMTLLEIACEGSSMESLSTLMLMLANASGTKSAGDDQYWEAITAEVNKFSEGVEMLINGVPTMVFFFVLILSGDTPAVKRLFGFSPSISKIKRPCRFCDILVENLCDSVKELDSLDPPDTSKIGKIRGKDKIKGFLDRNNGMHGVPTDSMLKAQMKDWGMKRVPEIIKWVGQGDCMRMVVDMMHAFSLGIDLKHFINVVSILTSNNKKKWKNVWVQMSDIFKRYCRQNKVSAFCNFETEKQFLLNMTAGSIKIFLSVSVHILAELLLIPSTISPTAVAAKTIWTKQMCAFQFWCIHVNLMKLMGQPVITSTDLDNIDAYIPRLMSYWKSFLPSILTMNAHYLYHMVELIKLFGPPKFWSSFYNEGFIGRLKPYFQHINYMNTEMQVFSKYLTTIFFEIVARKQGVSEFIYKRYEIIYKQIC